MPLHTPCPGPSWDCVSKGDSAQGGLHIPVFRLPGGRAHSMSRLPSPPTAHGHVLAVLPLHTSEGSPAAPGTPTQLPLGPARPGESCGRPESFLLSTQLVLRRCGTGTGCREVLWDRARRCHAGAVPGFPILQLDSRVHFGLGSTTAELGFW